MTDELSAPLRRKSSRTASRPTGSARFRQFPVTRAAFAVIFLLLGAAIARILIADDPLGGQPSIEVEITTTRNTNPLAAEVTDRTGEGPRDTPLTLTTNGPAIAVPGEAEFGEMPGTASGLAAPRTPHQASPDLLEETQYGAIPRIGPQGETPFSTYARASIGAGAAGGKPRIAIVVTGLGLNTTGTFSAIESLPSNITLAFAPYGQSLGRAVTSARADGHEIMLEIPLEPFDYPNNDPGPQTLLTGQPARANLDNLFWLMAQFGGYIGVVNNMGARFTASAADFAPIIEELGTRGLGYLDDGSSNRSLAATLAQKNRVPFARANRQIDATPSRTAILSALDGLVASARQDGAAIGVISALPVSIQTIAEWARGLEQAGTLLVPVSTLMGGGRA